MRTVELAYRIEPGAHMAVDENGNGAEAYFKIKLDGVGDNVTDEQIEKIHQDMAKTGFLGIDQQYVTPISQAEYDDNNEDEQNADADGDWDDDEDDFMGDDEDE